MQSLINNELNMQYDKWRSLNVIEFENGEKLFSDITAVNNMIKAYEDPYDKWRSLNVIEFENGEKLFSDTTVVNKMNGESCEIFTLFLDEKKTIVHNAYGPAVTIKYSNGAIVNQWHFYDQKAANEEQFNDPSWRKNTRDMFLLKTKVK